jgi:HicB family
MEMSEYVEALRRELASVTRLAGEDITQAADLIGQALESSVRLTLLDVLSAAAAEVTSRLDGIVVELRLAGGEPSFAVQAARPGAAPEPAPAATPDEDAGVARATLRLSEGLKSKVEAAAASEGISVNTWLVRAARRALDTPTGPETTFPFRGAPGRRITGTARS